jgi:rubrerythrin
MRPLKGSRTEKNLRAAFAGESQANRRYLYFSKIAEIEGHPEIAQLFRETAEGETGHAHGHLDYLRDSGDPMTGHPIGTTEENLGAAIAGEQQEYTSMYPEMAKAARDEGYEEIAAWFDTLARGERSHMVKEGQTLAAIAKQYQVTIGSIAAANGMDKESMLRPGQTLRIPERGVLYVQPGHSLARIARNHDVSIADLAKLNRLSPDATLQLGQRLV